MGQSLQETAFQRVPAARSARQVRRQHPESRGGITPTALAGCVLRFSLGLPPSSTCALRIEGNDRPETRCHTEGIDGRPAFLPEFLQPARLALSFSATSIQQSHRATDGHRINPVCYGSGEFFFSWGRGSETRCSCCRSGPPRPTPQPAAGVRRPEFAQDLAPVGLSDMYQV